MSCGVLCVISAECPQGLWGEECAELCNCSVRGTCLSHDGSCDCDPGWMGQSCQEGVCHVYNLQYGSLYIYVKHTCT